MASMTINARVSWPAAPLTAALVQGALKNSIIPISYITSDDHPLLQWSTYDEIDHQLVHLNHGTVLSSSYIFRKALIRKHYLSRAIRAFLTKHPSSVLSDATPRTYEIEISFADELEEMWTDELWELGNELTSKTSWWILKPGMADRGMGIRLFHTKEDLQQIFESFEEDSDESDDYERTDGSATDIVTSQLRHFVIQEYIMNPLLLDPSETSINSISPQGLTARKFHLRVYCLAVGDIRVYLYDRILALFSSAPYITPSSDQDSSPLDLTPHLTNTSLQIQCGDDNVRLLDELAGCHILSGESNAILRASDIDIIIIQIRDVLADTFKAALQNPIHFQALPNAFELFGVDFLVSHAPSNASCPFQTKILEINSEPAIELTGPRLTWILEDLFDSIAKTCVVPFFAEKSELTTAEHWDVGEMRHHLVKCLDEQIAVLHDHSDVIDECLQRCFASDSMSGPSTPAKKRSKWDEDEDYQTPFVPQPKRRVKQKVARAAEEYTPSQPRPPSCHASTNAGHSIYVPQRTRHPPIQPSRSVYSYERLNQIEEGSYGVVFRARDKQTGDIVALKKLKLDEEKNGFPITALREVYALMSCRHENVVGVREVVVGQTLTQVFVVMDFIEHDLKSLLTVMPSPFLQSEIKTLMLQLLSAVNHCHQNWILHRDLKTSNLLMNNRGTIKVADFGLARRYGDPVGVGGMTQLVVTLWYRAPEILLGASTYSTAVDMWSVGCIFAELLLKEPLFQAHGELELLSMIFKLLGPPTKSCWPDYSSLPLAKTLSLPSPQPHQFRQKFQYMTTAGIDLLMSLLTYDPERRISAEEALDHPYFTESPLPKHPDLFGSFPSAAAGEKRRKPFESPSAPRGKIIDESDRISP